jgi:uncharacterized membrane protein
MKKYINFAIMGLWMVSTFVGLVYAEASKSWLVAIVVSILACIGVSTVRRCYDEITKEED